VRVESLNGVLLSTLLITSIIALAMPLLSLGPVHAALTYHAPIHINGNSGFTSPDPVNGGGSGTENDSYIIENWRISAEDANGIWIENTTAYFIVRNCLIENGNNDDPHFLHYGIYLDNVVNGKIDNSVFNNNDCGIDLLGSSNNSVTGNTCNNNNDVGINLWDSSNNNTLENNTCENNNYGIHLDGGSDNNTIDNNTSSNNYSSGINIWISSNNILTGNTNDNNNYGIDLHSSSNNTIDNNTLSNNQNKGIYLSQSSGNLIYHNYLINNTAQAYDGGTNYWDDGYPSGGNYWSDYTGVDYYRGENQNIPGPDEVGDTPYNISGGNNRDRYPLVLQGDFTFENLGGVWSPWVYPNAAIRYVGVHDRTYITFVSDGGDFAITYFDHDTYKWNEEYHIFGYPTLGMSDHYTPAMLILPDGTILAFCFGQYTPIEMWKSSSPEEVENWIYMENVTENYTWVDDSFPCPVRLDNGRIYLFWRADAVGSPDFQEYKDTRGDWFYEYSDDNGTSWSSRIRLIDINPNLAAQMLSFVHVTSQGNNIYMDAYYVQHNSGSPDVASPVYFAYMDNNGNWWSFRESDPELLVLPLTFDNMVHPENGQQISYNIIVDNLNHIYIPYTDADNSSNFKFRRLAWDGATWSSTQIVETNHGSPVESGLQSHYDSGMMLDHTDPDNAYCSVFNPTENVFEIQKFTYDNGNWINVENLTSNSQHNNWRPISPLNASSDLPALWLYDGTYINHDNFSGILIASPQDENGIIVVRSEKANVDVKLTPSYREAIIGENLNYTIVITNIGTVLDNFTVTIEDTEGWGLSPGGFTVSLNPTENDTRTLIVTIPDNVAIDTEDNITVTATSQIDNEVSTSASCIGHAVVWAGTVTLSLKNLYKVGLRNDLQLYTRSKLVMKFYRYDSTFQAESIVDNIMPPFPYFIKENDNVPHPLGEHLEKVELVLTTDDTEEVISTMASFTVHRSDLRDRYMTILRVWAGQPPQQPGFRSEVVDILRQWSGAPT
jgi:parallel beta-helix repeat protein